ncbi:MAG: IS4 family transposase [Pseudobdellovibrionaceae bacterium]
MPSFDSKFNEKHLVGSEETRRRKFNPQNLFLSVLHLVGGKNKEGYLHALSRTWDLVSDLRNMPVKSALTKARKRVSFEFFKDCFDQVIVNYEAHRRTWRGLRVYATDGDRYQLPRSEDHIKHDYKGFAFSKTGETHYLQMYTVHCYDVLSGVTKDFRYSSELDEIQLGCECATGMDSKSITLYDRLFLGKNLVLAHKASNSFFIARCRTTGRGVFNEILGFAKGGRNNTHFLIEGVVIELLKVKNPRTKETYVYATNLARSRFKNKEISDLYALRWEVETCNRDLTDTMKIEQWHSQHLNGILQEIYASLWLMNQVRIQMTAKSRQACTLKALFNYEKSNFKLILDFILNNLEDLVRKRSRTLEKRLSFLLRISKEKRRRRNRSYPRQVKSTPKLYKLASFAERSAK